MAMTMMTIVMTRMILTMERRMTKTEMIATMRACWLDSGYSKRSQTRLPNAIVRERKLNTAQKKVQGLKIFSVYETRMCVCYDIGEARKGLFSNFSQMADLFSDHKHDIIDGN